MTKFDATEDAPARGHWKTLRILGSHLWPEGRWDLRVRILLALLALEGVGESRVLG